YAPKITKAEARLDWNRSAWELDRQIRAFNPHPVAYCELNGQTFRIWEAEPVAEKSSEAPGAIIAGDKSGINITTADGVLRLHRIQPAGKRPMTVAEFLNGQPGFYNRNNHLV
ncbi:MAG: methionyl-tRNA formyltransferase, partial [Gammaproteobacteria bacterium]